jgi:hypothetical protein
VSKVLAILSVIFAASLACAEELPSIEPWKHKELVNRAFNDFCGLSMIGGPFVSAINAYPLLRSSFGSDYTPSALTKQWVYVSQASIFGGFAECLADATYRHDSVWAHFLATGIGAAGGYFLAKSAFSGSRVAAVTSVAIPAAPVIPFVLWVSHF